MATANQFARNMARRGQQVVERQHRRVNELALAILLRLLQNTPVDTSQALSNWILSLGSPTDEFIGPYVPGILGSTRQMSIGAAYNAGMYSISDRHLEQTVYLSNSAPYIVKLNNGSSNQAPSGFFQTEVMNAVRSARGFRVLT